MVSSHKITTSVTAGAFPSRLDAPKRGVEPTSPVSGRESTTCEAPLVCPPDVGASQVGVVDDDFAREVRARAYLARERARDVGITIRTMKAAGMPLLRAQLLVLRDREARFGSLATRLEALDRRISLGRVDDEGNEDVVTRRDPEWLSLSRLSSFRELDTETAEEMERDREDAEHVEEMDAFFASIDPSGDAEREFEANALEVIGVLVEAGRRGMLTDEERSACDLGERLLRAHGGGR